jgi:hypothetical protein
VFVNYDGPILANPLKTKDELSSKTTIVNINNRRPKQHKTTLNDCHVDAWYVGCRLFLHPNVSEAMISECVHARSPQQHACHRSSFHRPFCMQLKWKVHKKLALREERREQEKWVSIGVLVFTWRRSRISSLSLPSNVLMCTYQLKLTEPKNLQKQNRVTRIPEY